MTNVAAPGRSKDVLGLFPSFSLVRKILDLLSQLREIGDPLTSAKGLRDSLAVLLALISMLGVDAAFVARVQKILDDQGVFNIVLAIVQYLHGLAASDTAGGGVHINGVTVEAQAWSDWLPLVIELVNLLMRFRK